MDMGSFLKSSKSQVEIINKIWRNMYFSAIQNCRIFFENSCLWPPIVMQISTKPIKCGIIL